MNENSIFDINRIKLLLIRQLRFSTQTLFIGFGAVAGLIVFILALRVIFGHASLESGTFFGLAMPFFFAGGYVFTSTIFSELKSPQRGYMYLTLPTSTLEKLIVSWFITSILYIAASIVVLFLINLFLMAVALIFSANHVPIFNLFDPSILKTYAVYLVTQSVFVLGAIYFRGANFLKTLLTLFVICFIISVYISLASSMIVFHNFYMFHSDGDMPDNIKNFFENIFAPVIKVLFWYCLSPFFLVVSYFRLKEREV